MFRKKLLCIILIYLATFSISFSQESSLAEAAKQPESEVRFLHDDSKEKAVMTKDIYRACKKYFDHLFNTRENLSRKAMCSGYFFGIGSTLLTFQMQEIESKICLPMDISTDQIIKDFLKWAKANLYNLDVQATEGVLTALLEMYPCKDSNTNLSKQSQ